jgi:hypothetical protein
MTRIQRLGRRDHAVGSANVRGREKLFPIPNADSEDAEAEARERLLLFLLDELEDVGVEVQMMHAAQCIELTFQHFFGNWRNVELKWQGRKVTPETARKKLPWMQIWKAAAVCGLSTEGVALFSKVVDYVEDDLGFDEATRDFDKADNKYEVLVSRFIRGKALTDSPRLVKLIREGKGRRPRMLLDVLEAVEAGDSDAMGKRLAAYLAYFRKTEFRTNRLDCTLSMEGSVLWHLARRKGMKLPKMKQADMDHIVLGPAGRALIDRKGRK